MKHLMSLLSASFFSVVAVAAPVENRCADDDLGRQVCANKPIERIISMAPSSTELVYAAGGGSKLIAVDNHSDYPESVKSLPRIGGYPNISAEAILAMKPDLIVIWSGGNDARLSSQLEALGLRVFYSDPLDFDAISSVIERLGVLMDTGPQAEQNIKQFNQRYQAVKARYQQVEPVNVFFEIWDNPLMTVNGGQIISQSIELCGGVNVFADARPRVPKVSIEAVIAKNPEAIVSSEIVQNNNNIRKRWQRYKQIDAVKHDFLFTIAGDLITRPTPRALDGAEILCRQLESVRAKKEKAKPAFKPAQGKL